MENIFDCDGLSGWTYLQRTFQAKYKPTFLHVKYNMEYPGKKLKTKNFRKSLQQLISRISLKDRQKGRDGRERPRICYI